MASAQETQGKYSNPHVSDMVHKAILDLVPRIKSQPEFLKGLATGFFGRAFRAHERGNGLYYGAFFPMGDFRYNVSYQAGREHHDDPRIEKYGLVMRLELLKFLQDDGPKLGDLYLYTYFKEDRDREVLEYGGGSINIYDGMNHDNNPDTAFAKIPYVFPDFYRIPKL